MTPGKEQMFVLLLLIATLHVVILRAAPAGSAAAANATKPSTNATKPADSVDPKPSNLTNPSTNSKPQKLPSDHTFGSCWNCLLEAVEELCSYLTNWTSPKKMPSLNLFSLFHDKSSEESDENSNSSGGMSSIASLFRFKRSVEDHAVSKEAFLDFLDGFYLKSRERFIQEHPGVITTRLENMYDKSDEIAQVVAYVLGVPKETLVQVFEKMKTKDTGNILLKALSERRIASSGKQENGKTIDGLTPTSISYFFQELLGSFSGIMTGFSEILNIALQNQQNTNVKPNKFG